MPEESLRAWEVVGVDPSVAMLVNATHSWSIGTANRPLPG
jgi:hypothetical protein